MCSCHRSDAGQLKSLATSTSIWLVLLAALVAANLPFVSQRLMAVIPMPGAKGLGTRLLELLVFYGLVGALSAFLENRGGQIAPQGWEFYAITLAVFATLAFPGFVYRYLLKRHSTD